MKMSVFASLFALLIWATVPSASFAGSLLGNSDGPPQPPGFTTDLVDDVIDNCTNTGNPAQVDTDLDGCGNACDGDFNQNGVAGGDDFTRVRFCFGKTLPASVEIPAASGNFFDCAPVDSDGNGVIGGTDFAAFRAQFGLKPGPSLNPLRKPALCRAF